VSRFAIQGGEGAEALTPRTTRATYRSQPARPERPARGVGILTSHAAHAEAVSAIRGDGNLDDLVGQAEQLDRVVAWGQPGRVVLAQECLEHHDAFSGIRARADTKLGGGADHAVADMAVSLSGCDGKAAGQERPGEHDDHEVIEREVLGATDDSLRRALGEPLTVLAHVHLTPADRLAVRLRFLDELQDPANDEGTADVATVQALLLQAHPDQAGGDLATGRDRRPLHVLGKPRNGRPHQISIPNCVLNRTSPSTISRMSLTP